MGLFIVVLTSGVSVPAELEENACVFLLLSTSISPLPWGDIGQMSLLLLAQAHGTDAVRLISHRG
jgi:hypothetical protein